MRGRENGLQIELALHIKLERAAYSQRLSAARTTETVPHSTAQAGPRRHSSRSHTVVEAHTHSVFGRKRRSKSLCKQSHARQRIGSLCAVAFAYSLALRKTAWPPAKLRIHSFVRSLVRSLVVRTTKTTTITPVRCRVLRQSRRAVWPSLSTHF